MANFQINVPNGNVADVSAALQAISLNPKPAGQTDIDYIKEYVVALFKLQVKAGKKAIRDQTPVDDGGVN